MYLEKEASGLYFNLSLYSFYLGTLSVTHFLDRMLSLKDMCNPNDLVYKKVSDILLVEECNSEDNWLQEENENNDNQYQFYENRKVQLSINMGNKEFLQFISKKVGLKDWIFNPYDRDFHPSIPHGHHKEKMLKLDSYLGWVYQKTRQVDRLDRRKIIDLWNDEEFRDIAIKSINWYIDNYPRYKWRVDNPKKIPRCR